MLHEANTSNVRQMTNRHLLQNVCSVSPPVIPATLTFILKVKLTKYGRQRTNYVSNPIRNVKMKSSFHQGRSSTHRVIVVLYCGCILCAVDVPMIRHDYVTASSSLHQRLILIQKTAKHAGLHSTATAEYKHRSAKKKPIGHQWYRARVTIVK